MDRGLDTGAVLRAVAERAPDGAHVRDVDRAARAVVADPDVVRTDAGRWGVERFTRRHERHLSDIERAERADAETARRRARGRAGVRLERDDTLDLGLEL